MLPVFSYNMSEQPTKFGAFNSGTLLLMRVIAATLCVTLAASLAARQGSTSMAAFQVCLQIWLATSLLADGLAVAGQVSKRTKVKVNRTAMVIIVHQPPSLLFNITSKF